MKKLTVELEGLADSQHANVMSDDLSQPKIKEETLL